MTRWLVVVATAALLAGAAHAGATEFDVDDIGEGCSTGGTQLCNVTVTEICTEWTWVSGSGSLDPKSPGGGARIECKTKVKYEKREYYR